MAEVFLGGWDAESHTGSAAYFHVKGFQVVRHGAAIIRTSISDMRLMEQELFVKVFRISFVRVRTELGMGTKRPCMPSVCF
jgi:hypothetical protein